MNGLPYYKRYPRDFIEGTLNLPFEIKAGYGLLLDLIYMQGGDLPDDDRYISGLMNVSVRKWKSIRQALISARKITASEGFIRNERAIIELETLSSFGDNQAERARKPRKFKGLRQPKPSHTEPEAEERDKSLSKRAVARKKTWRDELMEAFENVD